jgi:hypothetical protein
MYILPQKYREKHSPFPVFCRKKTDGDVPIETNYPHNDFLPGSCPGIQRTAGIDRLATPAENISGKNPAQTSGARP